MHAPASGRRPGNGDCKVQAIKKNECDAISRNRRSPRVHAASLTFATAWTRRRISHSQQTAVVIIDVAVGIAQLAEHRTVAPTVAGSIPVSHPRFSSAGFALFCFVFCLGVFQEVVLCRVCGHSYAPCPLVFGGKRAGAELDCCSDVDCCLSTSFQKALRESMVETPI